jgi:hypothetical protein
VNLRDIFVENFAGDLGISPSAGRLIFHFGYCRFLLLDIFTPQYEIHYRASQKEGRAPGPTSPITGVYTHQEFWSA